MYIRTLMENTLDQNLNTVPLTCEHGLSFYVEAGPHKLLIDTGASGSFMDNARKLGIDLSKVDAVLLSHGHYDHGGGLPAFLEQFPQTKVYLRREAFGCFYSVSGGRYHRIGISPDIRKYPQIIPITAPFTQLDDTVSFFANVTGKRCLSEACNNLLEQNSGQESQNPTLLPSMFHPDSFAHEQGIVITEGEKRVLFSSCSHKGIINILDTYDQYYDHDPDLVIGGFHLMDPGSGKSIEPQIVKEIASELRKRKSVFYTGHCTGLDAYQTLKKIMGEQLHYCHTGDTI